ncbi:IclR family transcriptional regulator [Rhodococcus koreensis]|uniref:IclR family transcriptional regulator n=1 Tax=Rhodococcus koreensis TaxID=99653 RepID=UPI00366CEAD8
MTEPQSGGTTLRTLTRGLEVLETIAAADGTMTAKAIARTLDLNLGTCYHILKTLQQDEFVIRLRNGAYVVGARAARLSKTVNLHTRPEPALSALLVGLNQKTRETVYISGWYHGVVTLQEWIAGSHILSVGNLDVGYSGNLHTRASCKAILAHLPPARVEAMLPPESFVPVTPNSITDFDTFAQELVTVKKNGFAVDNEEFEIGVSCIAAPFFDEDRNPVGAFAVSAPTTRFAKEMHVLAIHVRDAADRATGYLRTEATGATVTPLDNHRPA